MMVIILILAFVIVYAIGLYNGFIRKMNAVEQARSGIEVALTKRYDMLTKMRDVAKGYAVHEKEVFAQVIAMRRGMSLDEMKTADDSMSKAYSEVMAVVEAYPQLASNQVFKELQISIRDAEDHLQAARRAYNVCVTTYNNAIEMFPSRIIAEYRGCRKAQLFEGSAEKMNDVSMKF